MASNDLNRVRALVIGVGGLGSPAALALASAGVGTLGLIDPDRVEVSNLHRQPLYEESDVGRPKVAAAAERLRARHPSLRIEIWEERFGATHTGLARRFDVLVDGTDTIAAKFAVNDAAVTAGVPFVHAGVVGFRAQVLTVVPGESACYRCIFEDAPPPDETPGCEAAGVLGPVPAIAGAIQASEAVRLLGHARPALVGRLLAADLLSGTWRVVPVARNRACAACGSLSAERRSEAS
jgi:molybdopterin/thiamine biosynthesis adenylyltransferase